jgi:hypothetical protein
MATVEIKDGKIVINPQDLFENLTPEEQTELAQHFAWDSVFWNEIKEQIRTGYGRFRYNEDTLRLRVAFLSNVPEESWASSPFDRVADVICALMEQIKHENDKAYLADKSYWKLFRWVQDKNVIIPKEMQPDYPKTVRFSNEAQELLKLWIPEESEE